ncbi:SNF2 family helicase [Sarocladium implicatum]|nr:SNF2 family helicase [Sarocladium implicatum]
MASIDSKYIAAGCLFVSKDEANLNADDWGQESLKSWHHLSRKGDDALSGTLSAPTLWLESEIQDRLLKTTSLAPFARLLRAAWIRLEFKITPKDESRGVLRVYLLPDDVDRRAVDRTIDSLRKARRQLLEALDCSRDSWEYGSHTSEPQSLPGTSSSGPEHDSTTLLQLFNEILPPSPDPDVVQDPYCQDAIVDLLDSRVPGLVTSLYPYQRRSAALMCQREANPGIMPDPRLLRLNDQKGATWYMDPVSGGIFRDARFYDGTAGGILAEEMGLGKTIICLALILATRYLPTQGPEVLGVAPPDTRLKVASLADMAASCATRHGVSWKPYLDAYGARTGYQYSQYAEVLQRNPGFYMVPPPEARRATSRRESTQRQQHPETPVEQPKKIYLSSGSIVIAPNNLVAQWGQEINKHTEGLKVLTIGSSKRNQIPIPELRELVRYDIILFSQGRFEQIGRQPLGFEGSALTRIHFKRCIVDEGHRLGNSRMGSKSVLLLGLDMMHFGSRWIVTGTPSHGLYGTDAERRAADTSMDLPLGAEGGPPDESSTKMEKKDLERIGAISGLYLKARPWANSVLETGDTVAHWSRYVMLPKHDAKSRGNWDSLRSTLNSLIIRHPKTDVGTLLPPVQERLVVLEGSYQDRLSLNLFSMMIIFNAVQSERTDMDYFFHPKQKKHVLQIVSNMKQSSFFGGSFFSLSEIQTSVETAEKFLEERKVPISTDDEDLLRDAIKLGHIAAANNLRLHSNQYHEMPLVVENFPGTAGPSWSLSGEGDPDKPISTSASLILGLQKLIFETAGAPEAMNALINGNLADLGATERYKIFAGASRPTTHPQPRTETMAGNTRLGDDSPRKARSHGLNGVKAKKEIDPDVFNGPLKLTKITATVSAKLSYLIDSIVKYQEHDKIIIFYENENVAWYLSATLDVLQIQHLIYAKGLSSERRAQYVTAFHNNPTFRVLLMDLSQAAFGLDMREASRVYFINPVLNPQVEAQAIGRVRRIHQKKTVYVETLVLKDSIDEVILERKEHMTQAEHRQAKSILDIRPIYNWIKNTKVSPLPPSGENDAAQMAPLKTPQNVFGRGFGQRAHPDEGLVQEKTPLPNGRTSNFSNGDSAGSPAITGSKRSFPDLEAAHTEGEAAQTGLEAQDLVERPARRVRFAGGDDNDT